MTPTGGATVSRVAAGSRVELAGVAIAPLALVLILVSGCGSVPRRVPATHPVVIRAMHFEPAVLHAAPGDTVRWINLDLVPHTVTSVVREYDSGNLPPDSSWALVLDDSGVMDYACLYHPGMKGSIVAAHP